MLSTLGRLLFLFTIPVIISQPTPIVGNVSCGQTVNNTILQYEYQFYRFQLDIISIVTLNDCPSIIDPTLIIFDDEMNDLSSFPTHCNWNGDDCGVCPNRVPLDGENFTMPLSAGIYYIQMTPCCDELGGYYEINIECSPISTAIERNITCNELITNSIESSDIHFYQFIVPEDVTVHIEDCSSDIDPTLVIYDQNGYDISETWCNSIGDDCGICPNRADGIGGAENFTIPILRAGIYYVKMAPFQGWSSGLYEIQINCSPILFDISCNSTVSNNINQYGIHYYLLELEVATAIYVQDCSSDINPTLIIKDNYNSGNIVSDTWCNAAGDDCGVCSSKSDGENFSIPLLNTGMYYIEMAPCCNGSGGYYEIELNCIELETRTPTNPTFIPSSAPTGTTNIPSITPTINTYSPSIPPTITTITPTDIPTSNTVNPTVVPTRLPTISPTALPTIAPIVLTVSPTVLPSIAPTTVPTVTDNTINPSVSPIVSSTDAPTQLTTEILSSSPTNHPSILSSMMYSTYISDVTGDNNENGGKHGNNIFGNSLGKSTDLILFLLIIGILICCFVICAVFMMKLKRKKLLEHAIEFASSPVMNNSHQASSTNTYNNTGNGETENLYQISPRSPPPPSKHVIAKQIEKQRSVISPPSIPLSLQHVTPGDTFNDGDYANDSDDDDDDDDDVGERGNEMYDNKFRNLTTKGVDEMLDPFCD